MRYLRVIDQHGNNTDYETDVVPRIGERLMFNFKINDGPFADHFYRVKDVEYRIDNAAGHQVALLVEEEARPTMWPS